MEHDRPVVMGWALGFEHTAMVSDIAQELGWRRVRACFGGVGSLGTSKPPRERERPAGISPAMDSSEAEEVAGCGGDAFAASDAAPAMWTGERRS